MKADEAMEIDCPDIIRHLQLPAPAPPLPPFVKGFVVIQTDYELDVVGVYTASAPPLGSSVMTLSIERVHKRP